MRRRLRKKTGGTQKNSVNPWGCYPFLRGFLKKIDSFCEKVEKGKIVTFGKSGGQKPLFGTPFFYFLSSQNKKKGKNTLPTTHKPFRGIFLIPKNAENAT
jgi:hypothetical protein